MDIKARMYTSKLGPDALSRANRSKGAFFALEIGIAMKKSAVIVLGRD